MLHRLRSRQGRSIRRLLNLANVSIGARGFQIANAAIVAVLGRSMRIAHVVEFPKSGGSWIRDMLRTYRGIDFKFDLHLARPRDVLQRHSLRTAIYHWPIVVVRDPRDVLVSLFHHETTLRENRERELDIDQYFVRDPTASIREDFSRYLSIRLSTSMHPWFTISEFVQSWTTREDICLVRYEDMVSDAHLQLKRILEFVGDPIDLERIDRVVDAHSFETQTQARYGSARRLGEQAPGRFLRRGGSGDWKNHFTPEACELVWEHAADAMIQLGYTTDQSWIDDFKEEFDSLAPARPLSAD